MTIKQKPFLTFVISLQYKEKPGCKVQAASNFRSSICVQMNFNVDIRDPRPKITKKKWL